MAVTVVNEKWVFNSSTNECQPVKYDPNCMSGSATGSVRPLNYIANLFDSKSECLSVCPALTHCERTREKNMEMRKRYQHFNYVPNCDPQVCKNYRVFFNVIPSKQ